MNIEKRYQYRVRDGVKWTKWFMLRRVESKDEARELIKTLPKITMKLKNEYRVSSIE